MKNLEIWLITLFVLILLIVGLACGLLEYVVNPAAFAISLIVIFLVLFLVIISSVRKH